MPIQPIPDLGPNYRPETLPQRNANFEDRTTMVPTANAWFVAERPVAPAVDTSRPAKLSDWHAIGE